VAVISNTFARWQHNYAFVAVEQDCS